MAYSKRKYSKKKYTRKPSISRKQKKQFNTMWQKRVETKERVYPYTSIGAGGISLASVGYGSSAAATTITSGISQGTAGNQRVGRKIFLRGVYFNLALQPGDNSNYFRLLLVRPKGNTISGSSSTSTIITDVLSGAASSNTQWLNPVDTDKHQVYMDKRFYFRFTPLDGSTTTTVPQTRFVRKLVKINKSIEYVDDTASSSVREFFVIAISDSAAISHPGAVAGFIKLYFQDV